MPNYSYYPNFHNIPLTYTLSIIWSEDSHEVSLFTSIRSLDGQNLLTTGLTLFQQRHVNHYATVSTQQSRLNSWACFQKVKADPTCKGHCAFQILKSVILRVVYIECCTRFAHFRRKLRGFAWYVKRIMMLHQDCLFKRPKKGNVNLISGFRLIWCVLKSLKTFLFLFTEGIKQGNIKHWWETRKLLLWKAKNQKLNLHCFFCRKFAVILWILF